MKNTSLTVVSFCVSALSLSASVLLLYNVAEIHSLLNVQPRSEAPILTSDYTQLPAKVADGIRYQLRKVLKTTPEATGFTIDQCETCRGCGWELMASAAAAPEAVPLPEPPEPAPTGRSVWIPGQYEDSVWVEGHWEEPPADPEPLVAESRIAPITPPEPGFETIPVEVTEFDVGQSAVWTREGQEIELDMTLRVPHGKVSHVLHYLLNMEDILSDGEPEEFSVMVPKLQELKAEPRKKFYWRKSAAGPEPVDEPEPIGDRRPPVPDTGEDWSDDDEEEEQEIKPIPIPERVAPEEEDRLEPTNLRQA